MCIKVILCAYEHIFLIVRYRYISVKQLKTDPLHVLTDANVLVLVDTDQKLFVNGRFSLPSDIHRSIMYAYHRCYLNIVNFRKLVSLRQYPLLKKTASFFNFLNILPSFSKMYDGIYMVFHYVFFLYINHLLYVHSFS